MKKILIILTVAGGLYYATRFKSSYNALKGLQAKIKEITGLSVQNGMIKLTFDLGILNTSNFNLGIDTLGLISIRKLRFFNSKNRRLIGEARVNIDAIEVPSKHTTVLKGIIAEIPTTSLFHHFSLFKGNASENIRVVPKFTVAGKEYEINPEKFV